MKQRFARWWAKRLDRSAYDPIFDAYYNPTLDRWLEPVCGDPGCGFCLNRPQRPSGSPFQTGSVDQ